MNCPHCGEYLNRLKDSIINRDRKNFLVYSCPYCQGILKEKETKYSQGTRISFLILVVPILFLFLLGVSLVLNTSGFWFNTFYSSFIFFWVFFILLFISVRFFVWKKMSPDSILKTEKWNTNTKQPEIFESKRRRYLIFIFYFLLMLAISYPKINELFENIKKDMVETRKMDEDMKNQVVDGKARVIMNELDMYYQVVKQYPKDFSAPFFTAEDNIVDINTDFERKYFGRALDLSDFMYTTSEDGYKLCFDLQEVTRCWEKK